MIRVVVASGKGGTGKTMVATSLAEVLEGQPLLFLDCDVEAPNAHLFLRPEWKWQTQADLQIPQVDEARCTLCGKCADVCQFHAITVMGGIVLVFPELCHGCGSCSLSCPEDAIREQARRIGQLDAGRTPGGAAFASGTLDVGQPMAVPVIRQLKRWQPVPGWFTQSQIVILDAPPGTSCPVVESLHAADFALLVTEPTPFGLHDLRLMVDVVREMDVPAGVIVNRDGIGNADVDRFCDQAGLPVLMRIPLEREIGQTLARGETLLSIHPEYWQSFQAILAHVRAATKEPV